ncbi:AraC family transcriptional regulator [Spirosoma endophyticum]|uniref:Helix-turn-helix domain-containing protein n=1 Tax=Spirosoma endophyticum TaxID=662367 RepID=A0A1I1Z789_9BACT|nr:helix-turn-helix domain-containing protein [Spirosoma endophyticum]SFE26190.1 Helix-turn-helix domain-containing protein [Spirosoma endophyticum]
MLFKAINPQNQTLKKYIQYILFNQGFDATTQTSFTSYPNHNICLGIIQGQLIQQANGQKVLHQRPLISSYISGLYTKPNTHYVMGCLDEICIDFTVAGYYRFFALPAKQFVLDGDVLSEAFGSGAIPFFETVFQQADLSTRCQLIEQFLLQVIKAKPPHFVEQVINCIDHYGFTRVAQISQYFNCSEKKLYRTFLAYYDLGPKEYLQLLQFRRCLWYMTRHPQLSLDEIAFHNNYFDTPHLVRAFHQFTDHRPTSLRPQIVSVDGQVLITSLDKGSHRP